MAKKRSIKSYLMMAKYHNSKKEQEPTGVKIGSGRESDSQMVDGQGNFGTQTSEERTMTTVTNESIQTSNSLAGDSSSGYRSGHQQHQTNQFYQARDQSGRHHGAALEGLAAMKRQQLVMVNEGISGETSQMWPVMIDEELGAINENIGGSCSSNKVHLIDDDDDDDDDGGCGIGQDVDLDSYDIDCIAASSKEDNNNISDRFQRHRYCVDARSSSPASRFDESFLIERQRHQHQQLQATHHRQVHPPYQHHHHQRPQQYFHQQATPNYLQQASTGLVHSQFQPGALHLPEAAEEQHLSRLNGVGSAGGLGFGSQQQPFVNYVRQPTTKKTTGQFAIPPTHYNNQQHYHTLVQYHHQQYPYSYTVATGHHQQLTNDYNNNSNSNINSSNSTELSAIERSSDSNQATYSHNQASLSLSSNNTNNKMQSASSRQYLTADSHHHKPSSRRKVQSSSSTGQLRKNANHVSGSGANNINKNKQTLDCCGKLAKLLLFTTNLLFWLLSWSFITLGCATILVGFCGCSAIFKNNRWILGMYIFLVLAIFALDLATGLLAIIFQEKLVANVRLRLANKLRADYGVQASFTAAIDYIQTRFECCGLEGHFDYDQSVWRLQRLGGFEATVARTCCHLRNTFDDQAHINPRPVNESMCQSTDVRFHQSYRYRKGCLDDLERLVRHKIWIFTLGCAAVGGVILISLMFATCFCRSIQSYSRKGSAQSSAANAVSSPKHPEIESQPANKSTRHFVSTGHNQISSQRHHHHK